MKRLLCLIAFLSFCITPIIAQTTDLKHYSSIQDGDYENNFEGVSTAVYIGGSEDFDGDALNEFKNIFPESMRDVSKLKKNNLWLCKKALNEWDYKEGEIYLVFCADNEYSSEGIMLVVTIIDKDEFSWWGKIFTEKDNEIFEAFSTK